MVVDFEDLEACKEVMRQYGSSEYPYAGLNEDDEQVTINVYKDHITVLTFQENGWMRKNVIWDDGTKEELFEGKWRDGNDTVGV